MSHPPDGDLCFRSAREMAVLVRTGQVSAVELVRAHLDRIDAVNPAVNAIVTLVPERALAEAARADAAVREGRPLGPLHGLPVAHKDLHETRGIRTTYGSPIFRDYVPDYDTLLVERVRQAGAILVGGDGRAPAGGKLLDGFEAFFLRAGVFEGP